MIIDRKFPADELEQFLTDNDDAFLTSLSDVLKRQGTNIKEYAKKLASLGTIAYEKDGERIKGAVIGYTHNLPIGGGSYITQVVTEKKYRNQGVCKRLLKEYFSYCKKLNIHSVWLTTEKENRPARYVYEQCGFQLESIDENNMVKYVCTLLREEKNE